MKLTISNPVLVHSPEMNEAISHWGVYAIPRMWREPSGETSCYSMWHGMNYTGEWISLPKGQKRIRVEIEESSEARDVFRFGYVVEAFLP